MEILYRAYDGSIFSTEEECLKHETEELAYRMYDEDGDPTYDIEDARVVFIYPGGASKLQDDFEQKYSSYSGISCHSTGWFHYCDNCAEWMNLPESLIKLLTQETP